MKKGILEFDIDDFESAESMRNALNADYMRAQIDSLYNDVFRKYVKYDAGADMTTDELIMKLVQEVALHFKDDEA